ncbi:uroporphyrinogen-III C-methyltransferase [Staphylococcus saccharolyticus]|uniref:uroporphyrinogen-III C-methyltransferase n=1 Tax=Staphylococcus saccharolyticus TaxID=33028 RepID=UPI00102D761C|nr:uroporphyrinogen-III C-methyltransferase [Staphylococcus saccharolyticus]MBL7573674.1 uroporphyrinogen-III C-methyltransferase [Staphylococcus saccharolyticus]MBL7584536.1 uroporphyrinogen-III C-methyltransferase [Staphylococcus saccharolyticus]MBL7639398.1 uroporphyrinogen-III C-methyltransferase [Staphylococcus saccharolyticus]QRJ68715.1 uroporphyrinogen-III C-methyltransferase [Staphylococcus saccharolyticus]TAA92032.1 uroporphyrinogen-III C-methyltransferase [Staphylococcus saccharolyti
MSVELPGTVYLIGAGPGNPNLLTKKAERLIKKADVILYDRLVNPLILQYASPETKVINVGKKPYFKHIQQEEINLKIVEAAKHYQYVVRLKGGDPAIFGRITEEVHTLAKHQINYKIVPGVTSASAAVASMNMGLTMRSIAPSVTFSTGHFKDSIDHDTDIRNLINGGTLAIYMGIKRLGHILKQIETYTDEDYPIAIVFNASCFNQQIITGTLSTIEHELTLHHLDGRPGICILGHLISYFDNTSIRKHEILSHKYYVIKGDKPLALAKAEELYEDGYQCLIDFDHHYHVSQQHLYNELLQHKEIEYIYV